PEDKIAERSHQVKKGETLASIAKRSGLPVTYLTAINKTPHAKPGRSILIPYAPPDGERWALVDESKRPIRRHRGHRTVVARKTHPRRHNKISRVKPTITTTTPKVATTEKDL
ncbi:MAG: LysM peptidoglycan-binding domain-containing protein, partial [Deltaproteobacteria bacterium]|nr:LysM peptidoglycan-binding domain-containing protein [Deltaproteobacteria bacterium]